MYVWILHCVLRTFEYLKIRVLISGTLPKTPDWRKFRHHDERCRPSGASSITHRLNSLLQDYTRSGFVVARQFFSRLFAIQKHVVIHLNCFYRIQGLIVDSIFSLFEVLRIWNSLPEDVVSVFSAAHLLLFISRLVRVNLNQFLIGKM